MESIPKNVPGGSQHCIYTPLIQDFAYQCITDILQVILQQAEMLHPPVWDINVVLSSDQTQPPPPTSKSSIRPHLPVHWKVKTETSYKKVAVLQKGLKMFLQEYILGPNYNQNSHK